MAELELIAFPEMPGFGVLATETLTVLATQPLETPKQVSRTKMSSQPHAGNPSSGVRFVAIEPKETNRPSALMESPPALPGLPQFPTEPSLAKETRLVLGVQPEATPVHVSRA